MQRNRGGGVGLLVNQGAVGFVGVDLDNVICDGEFHQLALDAIEHFKGAYVEVSPSSTGLRIFALGDVPADTPKGSTAIGQSFHGKAIKFEVYAAGGQGRFLRTTGALIEGTAGAVGPCQDGVEWLSELMASARPASPDNDTSNVQSNAGALSLDAVFDALAGLRAEVESGAAIEAIEVAAGAQPRGKLADAWRGGLAPWKGDHSTADLFICCEAIRRGAGNIEDVVEVWGASELGKREKFKRKDYRQSTVDRAARSVLADLQRKGSKAISKAVAVQLPQGLTEALALSGDVLTRTAQGKLEANVNNVVVLFRNAPELKGLLAFNALTQAAERRGSWRVFDRGGSDQPGPLSDDDLTRVGMWLSREYRMNMDTRELMRGLEAAAIDATFDPLATRLQELRDNWDGVPRVDTWLTKHAKADTAGCAEYIRTVGRYFLVGAVARALSPGCQMDTVLSLEGAGGGGKSTMFRVLADSVALDLFADGVHDVSSPAALVEGTGGRWIVELSELAGIRRAADVEALKASLTRTHDTYRRPYDVKPRTIPRRFVFVATTNRSEYLSDPSGALLRRFWPVRTLATETEPIDRSALAAVAGQLWGEAVRLYETGEKWHLDESDGLAFAQWRSGREERREDGAFQNELLEYLPKWASEDPATGRSLREIAHAVGDVKTEESGGTGTAAMQLAGTLVAMGMVKRKSGTSRWFFATQSANRFATMPRVTQLDKAGDSQKTGLKAVR